jgi:tryptophanase
VRQREPGYEGKSIGEIISEILSYVDIFYMSGRKCANVRGGLIATNEQRLYDTLLPWLPVYEGFATYGGMSSKEIEAMAVGLREMTDLDAASASADFVKYFVERLDAAGVPVVTPAGGLACHVDARKFLPDILSLQYPAGALADAFQSDFGPSL